jgi:outer membrane protein, heavy metal efflux system
VYRIRSVSLTLLFFSACANGQNMIHLDDLVYEGLEHNAEVLAAQKRYEAARQRPRQLSTLPDPVFSPGYTSNGAPYPGARLGTEPTSNIGFMISQEFPGPGKRRLRGGIAEKEAEAELRSYEAVRLSVAARIKDAFHRLHHTYAALEVIGRGKEYLTRFLRVAEARYAAGKAMQTDIFRAQTQLTILSTRILRMEQDRRVAEAELNSLLNRNPGAPIGIPMAEEPKPLAMTLDTVLARALQQTPAMRREQSMIERGQLAVNLARKDLRPGYTISAGYYNMGSMPDMYQFRLDIPLPFRHRQSSALNEQVYRLSEARHNYEAVEQSIQFRIREAYAQAETSFRLMSLYLDTVIPQSGLTVESSIASYQTGALDFLSVLNNLIGKTDFEERYHEEMLAYWSAVTRLEELTGLQLLNEGASQ